MLLTSTNNFTTKEHSANPPLNGGFLLGDSPCLVESQNLRRLTRERSLSEERFELLNQATSLLIKHHGRDGNGFPKHRTAKCCSYKAPHAENIEIHKTSSDTATYHNLETCSNVWACPVCSARISEIRRVELNHAVARSEYSAALLTFTLSHKRDTPLTDTIDMLIKAYHGMAGHYGYKQLKQEFGYVHAIRAFEVTWSNRNGWHPHFHVISLFDRELSEDEFNLFAMEMSQFWGIEVDRVGGYASKVHGFDARQADNDVFEYINKFGKEPTQMGWDITKEAMKGQFKSPKGKGKTPFQMLALSKDNYRFELLYLEYVAAMKGQKQLVWSRGLKAELGIDEIADELLKEYQERETELLLLLTDEQWKAILHFKWRGKLLTYAAWLDIRRLRSLVSALERAYKRKFPAVKLPTVNIQRLMKQDLLEAKYSARWRRDVVLGVDRWRCNKCGCIKIRKPLLEEKCCEK
jgi:hypothetical protein